MRVEEPDLHLPHHFSRCNYSSFYERNVVNLASFPSPSWLMRRFPISQILGVLLKTASHFFSVSMPGLRVFWTVSPPEENVIVKRHVAVSEAQRYTDHSEMSELWRAEIIKRFKACRRSRYDFSAIHDRAKLAPALIDSYFCRYKN